MFIDSMTLELKTVHSQKQQANNTTFEETGFLRDENGDQFNTKRTRTEPRQSLSRGHCQATNGGEMAHIRVRKTSLLTTSKGKSLYLSHYAM